MARNSTIADGQVAITTPAEICAGPSDDQGRPVSLTFTNVGGSSETLILTVVRDGGTARRIFRAVLAANEQVVIVGLLLNSTDSLKAVTSNAESIDYVAAVGERNQAFGISVYDANGSLKSGSGGLSGNTTVNGILGVTAGLLLTAGASTAAAGSGAGDAGALPAGTAPIYPTTAANDAKGVIIDEADQVTGRTFFIGNGVSNKILKVYPPSGGTINGASADAAFSSASGKGVLMYCLDGTSNTWLAW